MANDTNAAKMALCGFPITLSAKAKTAGMTIAARAALCSETRPESVRGNLGIAARILCATRAADGRVDPARRRRRATVSDHKSKHLSRRHDPRLTSRHAPATSLDEEDRLGAARAVRRADDRLGRLQRGDGRRRQAGDEALRRAVRARGREARGLPKLGNARDADYLARRLRRPELRLGWRRQAARPRPPRVRARLAAVRIYGAQGAVHA